MFALWIDVTSHGCPGAPAVNIMDRANDTKIDKCKSKVLEWGNILYTLSQDMESSLVLKSGGQLLRASIGWRSELRQTEIRLIHVNKVLAVMEPICDGPDAWMFFWTSLPDV